MSESRQVKAGFIWMQESVIEDTINKFALQLDPTGKSKIMSLGLSFCCCFISFNLGCNQSCKHLPLEIILVVLEVTLIEPVLN